MASALVPLADGCEELEAVTIIDLLRRGGVEVVSAGLERGPVKASRNVTLMPDATATHASWLGYRAQCSFAPFSTLICLGLGGLTLLFGRLIRSRRPDRRSRREDAPLRVPIGVPTQHPP